MRETVGFTNETMPVESADRHGNKQVSKPRKKRVSKLAETGEQPANVIPIRSLTSEQKKKQRQNANSKKTSQIKELLTSEQQASEQAAEWLHGLLPQADSGWWEVRPEGRGFTMKFRWRTAGKQITQPFPRVSRRQYQFLKESDHEQAIERITEHIAGHLEDLLFDPRRRDRARVAATRIGLRTGDDQNALSAN